MRSIMSNGQWKNIFRVMAVVLLCAFSASVVAICFDATPAEAATKKKKPRKKTARKQVQEPDRYASIVIDAVSGATLSEKNADKPLYPASLTKMMTLYLTFEAIENGTLRKNQRIPVSTHAQSQEPSKLGVKNGDTLRVEDAILALVTKSANDAAVVLGENIGGSESRFARMMTARAQQLGMRNTRFMNASGLFDPQQVSSARDMATLSRALMRHYPQYYRYFRTPQFTFAGATFTNHNRLMQTYRGMDGLKTGYVRQSGFNLAASAVRGNRRLIGVVFGGRTTASRNAHMAALLDAGFNTRATAQVARAAPGMASTYARSAPAAGTTTTNKPQFNAMGLVMKQAQTEGETAEGDADDASSLNLQARSTGLNLQNNLPVTMVPQTSGQLANALPARGGWTVQIGAFSSEAAGRQALGKAQTRLPMAARGASQALVPLMTSRGMIYRARMTGLDRASAADACRVLKGNCLILAAP
jgi:D-alanyl-D-alanine carboxypeptidase